MAGTSKRNGKIELLRFVFCIAVLMFHINKDLWNMDKFFLDGNISFFLRGRFGVEFFFLVSGYLAAKSAYKLRDKNVLIGETTYNFIKRKITTVFTPHIIVVFLTSVYIFFTSKHFLKAIFERLPSILFLEKTGVSENAFTGIEWYICSMLFALAIIYPFLLKYYDLTINVIAPIGSSLLIGYLINKYHSFPGIYDFDLVTYACNLRGLAVVLLGVFCFNISQRIKSIESKRSVIFLWVAENVCWIASLYFVCSNLSNKYEGIFVYIMAIALSITFSREYKSKIYNNTLVFYLGRISLPVYLCQNLLRNISKKLLTEQSNLTKFLFIFLSTIIAGMIIDFICELIKKYKSKRQA